MLFEELQRATELNRLEVEHEMRRMVQEAEAGGSLNLTRYGELASLCTLAVATEATCAALTHLDAERRVPV